MSDLAPFIRSGLKSARLWFFVTRYLMMCVLAGISAGSSAGMPDGPFLVFVDFSAPHKSAIAAKIREYMESDRGGLFCDDVARGPIIFAKTRPNGLSDEFLAKAILERDRASIAELQRALVAYRMPPKINEGLDGVIAYEGGESRTMLSIGAAGNVVRRAQVGDPARLESVVKAFCQVIPPIRRS